MGWIKLDRKILDNCLWNDKPFTKGQAWVDLLLLADYEDNTGLYRGGIKHYKSGVVYRSIKYLAVRWGWSRDKVRRYLKNLENEEMVVVNATTNDTTITIVNWAFFQGGNTTDKTPNKTTGKATHNTTDNTTDKTHTRNKEYKEYKEEKEIGSIEQEDDEIVLTEEEAKQWEIENGRAWEGWIQY